MANSWRALAKWTRDRILVSNPLDISTILNVRTLFIEQFYIPAIVSDNILFQLWALRLAALARLRLYNHASAETSALFSALSTVQPPPAQKHILTTLLPLELELARARMRYWNNDAVGYVDALVEVLRNCRRKTSKYLEKLGASNDVEEMGRLRVSVDEWKGNIARVGLVLASQLVEMKVSSVDYDHTGLLLVIWC